MLIESGLSTYRALIAITIVVLGKWFYRKLARRRAIGVALALCVALSPCAYFGVGLQLTFAALCGLWVGSRLAEANVATLSFSKCRTLIVLCFTAWVYTSVLVLFHFGHVVPLAPLYNLFLTPVFSSVVIVGGLLGIVLSALSFPGSGLLLEVVVSLTELILGLLSRYTLWGERSWAGALYFAPSEQNAIALGFLLVCLFLWVLADGTRHRSDADSTNRY
jgi:predicted membrane metal-binding protein